ncbi:MAG: flagellar biosynthesis protein FlhB [Nitrospirae bacterium]|nr:flagellar biosynthesis protein FlhB [Nitrospirota bacterium]
MDTDQQDKTEKATPKRRAEARKKGNVPRSREVTSTLLILGGAFILSIFGPLMISQFKELMMTLWAQSFFRPMDQRMFYGLMMTGMVESMKILLPLLFIFSGIAIISIVGQQGLIWTGSIFAPDLSRINPLSGIKKLFSLQSSVEGIKAFLKLCLIGYVAYYSVRKNLPLAIESVQSSSEDELRLMAGLLFHLALWMGGVISVLAAADYGYQRWEYERKIRMTKQEIKDEMRQHEGSPLVKSRIRSIQKQLSRNRMIAEVPKADVVVTNPTRLAVALMYKQDSMGAPRVVAKGAGVIAQIIREKAREHGIPVLENKPLARSLFKQVKVGGTVPQNLYRAVAEVLAYVYRLRGKMNSNPQRPGKA